MVTYLLALVIEEGLYCVHLGGLFVSTMQSR